MPLRSLWLSIATLLIPIPSAATLFTTYYYTVPEGSILFYFPLHVDQGEKISFRVILGPDAHDREGREVLRKYSLKWRGQVWNLSDPVVRTIVPPPEQKLDEQGMCLVSTVNHYGRCQEALSFRRTAELTSAWTGRDFDPPSFFNPATSEGEAKPLIEIRGPFDGDLGNTRIAIEGLNPTVLAETPSGALVAADADSFYHSRMLPDSLLGRRTIRLDDGDHTTNTTIHFYRITYKLMRSPKPAVGSVHIQLTGLRGWTGPLGYVFRAYNLAVQKIPDIEAFRPKKIKAQSVKLNSQDASQFFLVKLTSKFAGADDGVYNVAVPVRASDPDAWSRKPIFHGYVAALQEPERVRATAISEIGRWERLNSIQVEPPVQIQVVQQVAENERLLREIWLSFERELSSFNSFIEFVTTTYLYALRDHALSARVANRLLFMPESTRATISRITISFVDFLRRELLKALFVDALYTVETAPDGLLISTSHGTPQGDLKTNRALRLSLGEHELLFFSPKNGSCSCSFSVPMAGPGALWCDLRNGTSTSRFECSVTRPPSVP